MTKKGTNIIIWVMVILGLWGLLPFIILSFSLYPSADDYSLAVLSKELSFREYIQYYFSTLNGRYSAMILTSINPTNTGNIWLYRLLPFTIISGLFFSIYYFLQRIFNSARININPWLASLIFLLLIINSIPSTSEMFYWQTSAFVHSIPIILLFILFGILIKQKNNYRYWIFLFILSFFIAGFNEIAQLILILTFTINFLMRRILLKQKSYLPLIPIIAVLASIWIYYISNGTHARADQLDNQFNLAYTLINGIKHSVLLLGYYSQHISLWILAILLLSHIPTQGKASKDLKSHFEKIPIWTSIIISFLIILVLYTYTYFLLGVHPPLRVINTISIIFLVLCFLNILLIAQRINEFKLFQNNYFRWSLIIGLFFLTITDFYRIDSTIEPVFRSNISEAWYDVILKQKEYDSQIQSQIQQIKESDDYTTLDLDTLSVIPQTIHFTDFRCGGEFINTDIIKYYKRQNIE